MYELWGQTYPRHGAPNALGLLYIEFGQYDRALVQMREALELFPDRALSYSNLVWVYFTLGRLQEARATAEEAQAKKLDSPSLRYQLYQLAFLENDSAGMAQQAQWRMVKNLKHFEKAWFPVS